MNLYLGYNKRISSYVNSNYTTSLEHNRALEGGPNLNNFENDVEIALIGRN